MREGEQAVRIDPGQEAVRVEDDRLVGLDVPLALELGDLVGRVGGHRRDLLHRDAELLGPVSDELVAGVDGVHTAPSHDLPVAEEEDRIAAERTGSGHVEHEVLLRLRDLHDLGHHRGDLDEAETAEDSEELRGDLNEHDVLL